MAFCGQCGCLLSSRHFTCPNCGAAADLDLRTQDGGTNAPTVVSQSSGHPFPPVTPIPRSYPNAADSWSGIPSQGAPVQAAKRQKKGAAVALFVSVLVLLGILGSVGAFLLRQHGVLGGVGAPAPTPSPSQQARALVQQYYDDINRRDYYAAYNLWGRNKQGSLPPYDTFLQGYANTVRDNIIFGAITPNADGTVTVNLTIVATERTPTGGTRVTSYSATYIVGRQNGSWKLFIH